MAQQFTLEMIDGIALNATPNAANPLVLPDDLMAELGVLSDDANTGAQDNASDEVIEVLGNDEADLNSLLSEIENLPLDIPAVETPAITPVAAQPETPVVEVTEEMLAAAVASAAMTEEVAANTAPEVVDPAAAPTTKADGSDAMVAGSDPLEILGELESVGAEPAVAEEGAAPKEKKERKPREPRAAMPTDKIERLKVRVGEDLSAVSMLTVEDAGLGPTEALERTLEIIKGMNQKEQNRAMSLVEFIAGKKAEPNPVIKRLLQVLHRDGFLSTGEKGNVMADLLAKPYSPASARAMGANTVAVFADLMLVKSGTKGQYVSNPESVLLTIALQKLGLV